MYNSYHGTKLCAHAAHESANQVILRRAQDRTAAKCGKIKMVRAKCSNLLFFIAKHTNLRRSRRCHVSCETPQFRLPQKVRELELHRIKYFALWKQIILHCYLFASPLTRKLARYHQNKNGWTLVAGQWTSSFILVWDMTTKLFLSTTEAERTTEKH